MHYSARLTLLNDAMPTTDYDEERSKNKKELVDRRLKSRHLCFCWLEHRIVYGHSRQRQPARSREPARNCIANEDKASRVGQRDASAELFFADRRRCSTKSRSSFFDGWSVRFRQPYRQEAPKSRRPSLAVQRVRRLASGAIVT